MKIYLYDGHLGGLYLSLRNDLDDICPQCGDSDFLIEEYDIDEHDEWGEDIEYVINNLLYVVMNNSYSSEVFYDLINDLENIIKDLHSADKTIDKDKLLETIHYAQKRVIEGLLWFVDTLGDVEVE